MRKGIFRASELRDLSPLLDVKTYSAPIDLEGTQPQEAIELLSKMLTIRIVEETIGKLVEDDIVKCPCHLAIGQEAVAVGVSAELGVDDWVYGGHRSHAHFLAKGGGAQSLLCEVLGKKAGCSRGFGGSMHLYDPSVGFMGSVPIVGATIPIALGAAYAKKLSGEAGGVVSYFGDGATEEGVFHESLNLAKILDVSVLYVCENNLYSSHMDINLRQSSDLVSRFAEAHNLPALVVDGNDCFAVREAVRILLETARTDKTPVFLEAVTYRFRGHVGPDRNIDVGLRRKLDDLHEWTTRCPIERLSRAMDENGWFSEEELLALNKKIENSTQESLKFALSASYPNSEELLNAVFIPGASSL